MSSPERSVTVSRSNRNPGVCTEPSPVSAPPSAHGLQGALLAEEGAARAARVPQDQCIERCARRFERGQGCPQPHPHGGHHRRPGAAHQLDGGVGGRGPRRHPAGVVLATGGVAGPVVVETQSGDPVALAGARREIGRCCERRGPRAPTASTGQRRLVPCSPRARAACRTGAVQPARTRWACPSSSVRTGHRRPPSPPAPGAGHRLVRHR